MSQATFRSLCVGRPMRGGLLLALIAVWLLAAVGPAAAQEDSLPISAAAELPATPAGTPICGPTQNVGGAIATDTTWAAGKVYVLTGDITINQLTTLTIQPGAVVKINWDRGFTVNGKLVANGTAEHPIYFTSIKDDSICGDTNGDTTASVPNTGDWRRIDFVDIGDPHSAISRAVIRYGGRDDAYHDWWSAPIRFWGVVPTLNNITFEKNHRNAAAIAGYSWLTASLKPSNIIHTLEGHLEVRQANTFTIPAGLKFKPEWDQGVHVYGKLVAQGTAAAPILFTSVGDDSVCGLGAADELICDTNNNTTGSVPHTGDWRWIYFDGVSDPESVLTRAIIRYGGRHDEYNDSWAAPVRFRSVVPTLENISFELNYRNAAAIMGGDWLSNGLKSTTVVYTLESNVRILQANTFTIPAGVKIKPEWDQGIIVDGKLLVQGTPQQPVWFTSTADDTICGRGAADEPICDTNNNGVATVPAVGDWRWIDITAVSDPATTINGAIFRYGGRNDEYHDAWRAVLRINAASPTIANSAFIENHTGIDLLGGAQPTLTCNDFEGNTSPFGVYNDTPTTSVIARDNWWGHVSGPTHATNPHGKGDRVSDGVDFAGWRTTPCILQSQTPDAAFEATPTSGEAPLAVSFFNISSGAVTSSQWAFGDGGTSTAMNPTHVYTQPGVYSVTLTVTGPAGSDTVTNTAYVQVDPTTYRMFAPMIVRPRQ